MNIIEILYTILDINLISKNMIGYIVNMGVEIGKYVPFILVIGIVVGFIVYRHKNRLNWGLYRVKGIGEFYNMFQYLTDLKKRFDYITAINTRLGDIASPFEWNGL